MFSLSHERERRKCLQVLELSEKATEAEIKKAYKMQALKYHPDKVSYSFILIDSYELWILLYGTRIFQTTEAPRQTKMKKRSILTGTVSFKI
ncbi:chaperone protein Dnaj [Plakobranchus ocellatus]|uniref:Chaperone protein Dnaj n=1 Tax=Plakobranchus ocellatus TaxID=259542 RepID=A0AAV3YAY8_9GAST|nr:chaperone protein Dnaj [Plakobranchus ocellatus]